MEEGRSKGTVLEWTARGFGFIGLEDGRRAYVHHSQFGGGDLEVGEAVTAIIVQDRQNSEKWAAHDVQRGGSLGPRIQGVVASWNPRGFGFVDVDDGRRAYVHASQLDSGRDLQEGEGISCIMVEDQQNPGKWAAMEVQRTFRPTTTSHAPTIRNPVPAAIATHNAPVGYEGVAGPTNSGEERYEGIVAEWNERGFGFISLNDGRRVYVHSSAFGGGNLEVGEAVTAIIAQDRQNPEKWAAHDVQRGGSLGPRIQGVVASWNPRGFGFVDVDDGRRAYVHASQLDSGRDLKEGEGISCIMAEDQQNPGKWAAMEVKRIFRPIPVVRTPVPAAITTHNAPVGYGGFAGPTSSGEERYEGTVSEWNERGFGFIALNDGRRVYVHSSAFGGGNLVAGVTVNCSLTENLRDPSKLSAADVQLGKVRMNSQSESRASLTTPSWGAVANSPNSKEAQMWAPASFPKDVASNWSQLRVEGTVAQWNERGFGFIELEDKRRAYVHVSGCVDGDLCLGEVVSCFVEQDAINPLKWAAKDVRKGPLGEDGVVTSWSEQGGFGFISFDDGRRAYVHISKIQGRRELEIGQQLRVVTKPDERNPSKLCVAEIKIDHSAQNDPIANRSLGGGEIGEVEGGTVVPQANHEEDISQGQLVGSVIEWSERGFGFVGLDDGRRAYVHHNVFGGGNLFVGESVIVKVAPDRRNPSKLMVTEMEREQGIENANWLAGTICLWSEESGSGMLELDDGRFIEVTQDMLHGGSLAQGQRCEAAMASDALDAGTCTAISVRPAALDEGPPGKRPRTS